MASDQRYCLECGTRRAHASAAPLGTSQALTSGSAATRANSAGATHADAPTHAGTAEIATGAAASGATAGGAIAAGPARGGGPTAVIAGVGVLLLAMGVGVLIGRSGSGAGKASGAPAQVISVASPGVATTPTLPTTSTPTSTTTPSTTPKTGAKAGKSKSFSEVGQVPSRPAPPTVVPKAGGNGQSYEQKSKNLPNVVSTG